jgi:hypothetical protein
MRNGFNQLGRALSAAVVVVILAAPVSQAAVFLRDDDGGYGRVFGPGSRIVHTLKKWFGATIGDEMIIPRP